MITDIRAVTPRTVLLEAKAILKKDSTLNGTQLAQAIAGGYKGDKYPVYNKIILIINDLKRDGKL